MNLTVTDAIRGGGVKRKIRMKSSGAMKHRRVCCERKCSCLAGWVISIGGRGPFYTVECRFEVDNHRDCDCWTICLNFGCAAGNSGEEERNGDLI